MSLEYLASIVCKSMQVDLVCCGSIRINIISGLVHERAATAPTDERKTVQDGQRWNRDTSVAEPSFHEKLTPHVGETVRKYSVQSAKSLPIVRVK